MKVNENSRIYEISDLQAMSESRNYYPWLISQFLPYIGNTVLEVGAGSGTFTKQLSELEQVHEISALEPVHSPYALLKKMHIPKVSVHNMFLSEYSSLNSTIFDTIFYINVLEHVEYDLDELKLAHEHLSKNGYLCIYVPALQWLMGSNDELVGHYRRYYKKDLIEKLTQAGFTIVTSYYSDIIGIIPWYISFCLLRRKGMEKGNVRLYDTFIIPLLRFVERFIKPPIGKNLVVVARRNDAK